MLEIARLLLEAAHTREMTTVMQAVALMEAQWVSIDKITQKAECFDLHLSGSPGRIQVDFISKSVSVPFPDGVIDHHTVQGLVHALSSIRVPVLTMLVGIPGAGKSTWCSRQHAPVVSPDAMRRALGVDPHKQQALDPALEERVWATTRLAVAGLFLTGSPEVVLDATSVQAARRRNWFPGPDQFPELAMTPYRVRAVYIDTPLKVCLERRPNIRHVVERMARQIEIPTFKEPFKEPFFDIQKIDGTDDAAES
jgi:predicted kinase